MSTKGRFLFETFRFLKKHKKGEVVKNLKLFESKIARVLKNGDFLMIKGSNATRLHEVSERFMKGVR